MLEKNNITNSETSNNLKAFNFILRKDLTQLKFLIANNSIDLNSFRDFISQNQLAGYVFSEIDSCPEIRKILPEDVISFFMQEYLEQWKKNEEILKEMEHLNEVFLENGTEVIFLKGPLFIKKFYGDIAKRKTRDIDLLVRTEDFKQIKLLLEKNGYVDESEYFLSKGMTMKFTHHIEMSKGGMKLDLHWVLSSHSSFDLDYDRIWEEKDIFIYKDQQYFVLSDEFKLVNRILGILKDIEIGNLTLKSCLDARMLLTHMQNINWEEFFAHRGIENIRKICLNILYMIIRIFDAEDELVGLNNFLKCEKENMVKLCEQSMEEIFRHSKTALNNKKWSFSLYESGKINALLSWGTSLPFRMAMHKKARVSA